MMMTITMTTGMTGIKENGKQVCAAAESLTGRRHSFGWGLPPLCPEAHGIFTVFLQQCDRELYVRLVFFTYDRKAKGPKDCLRSDKPTMYR